MTDDFGLAPGMAAGAAQGVAQGASSNFLTRQIGPLPVWGWGIAAIGGVVLGLVVIPKFMNKGGTSATTDTTQFPTADTVPVPEPISTGPMGPPGPQGPAGPAGASAPTTASTPPVVVPTTTIASAKPAAPKGQYVTVKPWPGADSTLSMIAQHYYGNAAKWPTIYNANKALIGPNPNVIKTGMKLWLPAL